MGGESVVPCNYRLGIRRGFFFNSLFFVCLFVEVLPFLYFFLWFELVSLEREGARESWDPNGLDRYGYFGWKLGDAWTEVIEGGREGGFSFFIP